MSNDLRSRDFLGQGLAFPLQLGTRGQLALARGERDIEQAIRLILGTMPGERVMRPNFGCRGWELVFSPNTPETQSLMRTYVTDALTFWEPRIDVNGVQVAADPDYDGALLVEVFYTVKGTHDPRSIVYPFYVTSVENG
jgi:phage baseplate assembly protein W